MWIDIYSCCIIPEDKLFFLAECERYYCESSEEYAFFVLSNYGCEITEEMVDTFNKFKELENNYKC